MKRILYIVSTLQRNGPINVLYNLISHLDRNAFDPIILTLSPENPNHHSLDERFRKLNVPIHTLGLSRIQGFLQGKKYIKDFIAKESIDVVHINGFRGDFMLRASDLRDTPIVTTINSNIYDDYTMLYGRNKGKLMAALHMKSLKNKLAVGCSEFVSLQLYKRYNSSLKVIYNGIPKERYNVATKEQQRKIREELDLPIDKTIFLFVGSLIYRKDPITTIEGFKRSKYGEKGLLLIMGEGPLMAECKQKSENIPSIQFLGNKPDTLKYLNASDFYIASSFSEGLPTSVMEAMGCGLPLLLSEIAPHQELISKTLVRDFSFPKSDPNALSRKINEISEANYKSLSESCRNIIEERINADIMAKEYQKLYNH